MKYDVFSRFIFRSPTLPFNQIEVNTCDETSIYEKILDSHIQESIYLASPVLYEELHKSLKNKLIFSSDDKSLLFSLERYISRMSTRCTPFGLFAGCALGQIEDNTNIVIKGYISRKTRLDMHCLCLLYDRVAKMPNVKNKIKYYPNTSLYGIGKIYRFIESLYMGPLRKYQITQVQQSNYLNSILKIAENGVEINTLKALLTDKGISEVEATDFINELINSQFLVGELSQAVTGGDFFHRIIELLETKEGDTMFLSLLKDIEALLIEIDSNNNSLILYEQIESKINQIKIPYDKKFLFQVDSTLNTSVACLGKEVIDEVKLAITFLNKITIFEKKDLLSQFKEAFSKRYEDQEIPLAEVLDPDLGIGYPINSNSDVSPLIDDFIIPVNKESANIFSGFFESLLLKKTIECLSQNKMEIIFTDDDVKAMIPNWDDLPPTIYAMFEIIRAKKDLLIKMKACGGSCAANLLARFAHTDKGIAQLVLDITTKEQDIMSDVVLAEIVHLPESRTGNILFRPHIRDYELLYMSSSDLPENQLLYLSDMMLSVRDGRLLIRSKSLGKEIVPRLTTAHNFHSNTQPIYHFLCDMQIQTGRDNFYINWGQHNFMFQPRVRYKNTILSVATWVVMRNEIVLFFEIKDDDLLVTEIDKWRQQRSLPRYVLMPDGDNELFVDWENILSVRSLFSIIKKREMIIFTEFLFEPENAVVTGKDGVYLNECIVAFYKNSKQ